MSEWGFLIKSNDDIKKLLKLLKAHNRCADPEQVGEDLYFYGMIKENKSGNIFICCANGGGRWNTRKFIEDNYDGFVLWPFEKPTWWANKDKHTFLWLVKHDDPTTKNIVSPFDGKIYLNNV